MENKATGVNYRTIADYMIAADGANSLVRKELNIPVSGNDSWTDLLNIYFEADLELLVKGRELSLFLIDT